MPSRSLLPTLPDPDAPQLPVAVTAAAGFLAREVAGLFKARWDAVLLAYRLRPRQYLTLLLLRDEGATAQQAVGQRLGMDRTTTMQTVQALAAAGLVERQDDPSDRRVYRVTITEAGARLATELQARLAATEADLLAPLAPATREAFLGAMQQLLRVHLGGSAGDCGGAGKD